MAYIKRIQSQNSAWATFPNHCKLNVIPVFGDRFAEKIFKRAKNQFWENVVMVVIELQKQFQCKETIELHLIPLCYKSKASLFYNKQSFQKGFRTKGDVLGNNGMLIYREILVEAGWKSNHLEYETFRFNIANLHKLIEKSIPKIGPSTPLWLQKTGYGIKGCLNTYDILRNYNSSISTEVQNKWSAIINDDISIYDL